jgi:hypothetical protein
LRSAQVGNDADEQVFEWDRGVLHGVVVVEAELDDGVVPLDNRPVLWSAQRWSKWRPRVVVDQRPRRRQDQEETAAHRPPLVGHPDQAEHGQQAPDTIAEESAEEEPGV